MTSKKDEKKIKGNIYARNKRAFYDYEVLEKYEAGIVLKGSEVKSVKYGLASLKESFVKLDEGEIWLWNSHIPLWKYSVDRNYDPTRKRKLLLSRKEIDKIAGKVQQKGLTLIPLKMYGVRGRIKVEVGLCKGKKKYDKKRVERERTMKRELHEEKRKYMI